MERIKPIDAPDRQGCRWLPLILFASALLAAISWWANQYRSEVSLPRYCTDPALSLSYLERIITEPRPAGDAARRPYLVAAKLLYLVPRQADEVVDAYLARLAITLQEICR